MTLVLLNSRNREVFRGEAEDGAGRLFRYRYDNGGGYGSRDDMYRNAAVVMLDTPSAKPAGPLAGLFRQHCREARNRNVWPFSDLKAENVRRDNAPKTE